MLSSGLLLERLVSGHSIQLLFHSTAIYIDFTYGKMTAAHTAQGKRKRSNTIYLNARNIDGNDTS